MFNFEIEQVRSAGEIGIKKLRGRYYGATVADGSALSAITGKRSFAEAEYDAVLSACGRKWGVGLCEIEE